MIKKPSKIAVKSMKNTLLGQVESEGQPKVFFGGHQKINSREDFKSASTAQFLSNN